MVGLNGLLVPSYRQNGGGSSEPVPDTPAFESLQVTPEEAVAAKEAFITGAGTLVLPVVSVDGKPVGDGMPGPIATRLRRLYIERAKATAI